MEVFWEFLGNINLVHVLIVLIIAAIAFRLGRLKPKESDGKFWTTVFSNNKELDSTIRYVGILLLALAMVIFMHDDIKAEAGIIIVSLFNVLTHNGNGNGHNGQKTG